MPDRSLSPSQGLAAALPDVPVVDMVYSRREKAERAALREAFDTEGRQAFLRHLLTERSAELKAKGFTERNFESLRYGKVPHGYNVHHIKPLDDGGDNRFDNLVLLRAHPEHESIHRYLDPQLKGLEVGQSRTVRLPLPEAGAYRRDAPQAMREASQTRVAQRLRQWAGQER
ncbi:MAG TPA: HNH endonuclease signature motif containing protein [Magnetospirillaceae bacterium]|nr:HNH endonuclease signature motif containing protein [Magnetospirillaceae bacterium]